jgi:hypothetical protein
MLDKNEAILEHLPCKSMAQLAQQAQISKTWRVTKNLRLWQYKTTQVQVIEEGDHKRRMHFCNWFLRSVHNSALDSKLTFFTHETCFHLSGYINDQNNRYWSSIDPRQAFEVPLHD